MSVRVRESVSPTRSSSSLSSPPTGSRSEASLELSSRDPFDSRKRREPRWERAVKVTEDRYLEDQTVSRPTQSLRDPDPRRTVSELSVSHRLTKGVGAGEGQCCAAPRRRPPRES